MRVTKGTYKIANKKGWMEEKGSVGIKFPFMVHRKEGACLWKISHLATGYNIMKVKRLKDARERIEELEKYPVFLMPCMETWTKSIEKMQKYWPEQFKQLMDIIRTGL